jgi:hypothetical protein
VENCLDCLEGVDFSLGGIGAAVEEILVLHEVFLVLFSRVEHLEDAPDKIDLILRIREILDDAHHVDGEVILLIRRNPLRNGESLETTSRLALLILKNLHQKHPDCHDLDLDYLATGGSIELLQFREIEALEYGLLILQSIEYHL